jgi:hypothetical protein
LAHLDTAIIPRQATSRNLKVTVLASISLMCLFTMNRHPGDAMRRSLLEAWPAIWRWVEFVGEHFYLDRQSPLYMGDTIGYEVCATNIILLDKMRDIGVPHLARTPGVPSMAIKLWLRTVENGESQNNLHTQAAPFLVEFIHDQAPPHVIKETEEILRPQAQKVAASALEHLRAHLVGPQPRYGLFISDLGFIVAIHRILHSDADWWNNALLSHHSTRVLTSSLVDLTSKPFSHTTTTDIRACLSLCYSYLGSNLNSTDGFTWVTQTLNAQLLPAMLNSGRWMLDSPDCPRLKILTDILPGYLIYHSVLRAVERSMEKIKAQNLTSLSDGTVFWKAWSRFIALAEERLILKLEFDKCDLQNVACNNTSVRSDSAHYVHALVDFGTVYRSRFWNGIQVVRWMWAFQTNFSQPYTS